MSWGAHTHTLQSAFTMVRAVFRRANLLILLALRPTVSYGGPLPQWSGIPKLDQNIDTHPR